MRNPKSLLSPLLRGAITLCASLCAATPLGAMNLDEFFRYVEVNDVQIAPDGRSLLCATQTRNFENDRIESWIWRVDLEPGAASPTRLTRSGNDDRPRWAPDSRSFVFRGRRDEDSDRLYRMNAFGGEPEALPRVEGDLRDYEFSRDGSQIYLSVGFDTADTSDGAPLDSDVRRYDRDARATELDRLDLATGKVSRLAEINYDTSNLEVSPDGATIAFTTFTPSGLEEDVRDAEIFVIRSDGTGLRQLTRNYVDEEQELRWSEDGRWIYFTAAGDELADHDVITQSRLYRVSAEGGRPEWLSRAFTGSVGCSLLGGPSYLAPRAGRPVLATAQRGLDAPPAWLDETAGTLSPMAFPSGITWGYSESLSGRVAFLHSDIHKAPEVWVAGSVARLAEAKCVTRFNAAFESVPFASTLDFRYRAPDGREVEGMLTFPPGKEDERKLPLLVSLHGGPEFFVGHYCMPGYDEYRLLAAARGFLVFEPNYRGSYGYGDAFHSDLVGRPVSKPGQDVLAGVEELVKQGLADPDRLSVTGYSYGGYLSNWLITHSDRFRAAATGAGAVNHVSAWGNHDLTAWGEFLFGGTPYERRELYERESPFWLLPRVKTATHIVTGETDTTVPAEEAYQLYRGLRLSGAPTTLLIFPGESHVFSRPSHEREKIRSELAWLERYGMSPRLAPVRRPAPAHASGKKHG